MSKGLTQKMEGFCNSYYKHGNATQAYRENYECSKMKENTIGRAAFDLLQNSKITARMRELNAEATTTAVLTRVEALEILSARARVNFYDLVEFSERETLDPQGNVGKQTTWRIKNREELTRDQLAAISKLTAGRQGLTVEAHDPMAAIALLGKLQGWEAPQKLGIAGWDGGAVKLQDVTELSDAQLQAIIAANEQTNTNRNS